VTRTISALRSFKKIDRIRPAETAEDARRRPVLHFDNASPDMTSATQEFLQAHRMKRPPYPRFSPDLAPSDFYLSGKRKNALMGTEFSDEQWLFNGWWGCSRAFPRAELEVVFPDRGGNVLRSQSVGYLRQDRIHNRQQEPDELRGKETEEPDTENLLGGWILCNRPQFG
jgi:hypothetical protein